MSDNQTTFEIIRDIGFIIQNIEAHETVWFHVTNDDGKFFTARSSKGMPCGLSETSRAIEQAYEVTRNRPDTRDCRIKLLEGSLRELIELKKYKETCGKDSHYLREKIKLWAYAENVLNNQT